mgnify:CR=1 FL=1
MPKKPVQQQMDSEEAEQDSEEAAAIRSEVRGWLAENWDPDLTLRDWWKRLGQSGWGFPTWPTDWFGKGLKGDLAGVAREEIGRAGALGPPGGLGQGLGAPTVISHGTEEQKRLYLTALATGAEAWCQLFSEPGAGSDLASVQTRAVRDGDEWIVNGQKVWTSSAQFAVRGMLVARTNVDAPKHRGITYFIIDMDQPGVEVRPLKQMNGSASFNEVFFTDARVSQESVLGDVDNGWAVALTTLAFERSGIGGGGSMMGAGGVPGEKAGYLDKTVRDVMSTRLSSSEMGSGSMAFAGRLGELMKMVATTSGKGNDAVARQGIARIYIRDQVAKFNGMRARAAVQRGSMPGPEASTGKLAAALDLAAARDLGLSLLGAHGMLSGDDAPLGGTIQQLALSSPAIAIAGGTNEVQRNIIGERVLGLPKEPQVDRDVPFRDLKVGTQRRSD